ncbi:MAG: hypothetical protein U1E76_23830 [Planctomycetota bacterium]
MAAAARVRPGHRPLGVARLLGRAGRVPALLFVATLGMMSVGRGIAYLTSSGQPIRGLPAPFGETQVLALKLGDFELFVPSIVVIGLAAVPGLTLKKTVMGRHLYAGRQRAGSVPGRRAGATACCW